MKKFLIAVCICLNTLVSVGAHANPAGNQLGVCFADSLNGKERKMLAKWIFLGMAAHPDISTYANVSERDRKETDKFVGQLITRLFTSDCPNQAKAALNGNGARAFKSAFELVGQVAMRELMTDKNISISLTQYAQYLDKEKFRELQEK